MSGKKYPHLAKIRDTIERLRVEILQSLTAILQSNEMADKLIDGGYTEIDGRFCIMLRNTYKKGFGIAHGFSNTGRSVYIEPFDIVEPSNELRTLQAVLKQEETLIYLDMVRNISHHAQEIHTSATAVAEFDIIWYSIV